MEILIKLQYFEEFGKNKKLLELYQYFTNLYGRKTIMKDKISSLNLQTDDITGCFNKETQKQYIDIDFMKILEKIEKRLPNEALPLKEQMAFEMEVVGYISAVYNVNKNYCLVVDIDTKYSPRMTLHSLGSGKEVICKISKFVFNKTPLIKGQIIKCGKFYQKAKQKKTENGWEATNVLEWWLDNYDIIENLEV